MGWDGDQLPLRVAQGGEGAAEGAAGVDVDGAVDPLWLRHGRVAVHDRRPATVSRSPVVPDGQAELVRLPGRLPEEGEVPHPARGPALKRLFQPGVGDYQVAAVQDVVAAARVEERQYLVLELRRFSI